MEFLLSGEVNTSKIFLQVLGELHKAKIGNWDAASAKVIRNTPIVL